MNAQNIHEKKFPAASVEVAKFLDSLASAHDCLWPHETWPLMKLDKSLRLGSNGRDGPIHYSVSSYDPGRSVRFVFTGPNGFNGYHQFEIARDDSDNTILRHVLK